MKTDEDGVELIRLNSRVKHWILEDYLFPWAVVLGRWNEELYYFDCFAGCGKYKCNDETIYGSPVKAVETAQKVFKEKERFGLKLRKMHLVFSDESEAQVKKLEENLPKDYDKSVIDVVVLNKSAEFVIESALKKKLPPSFFFVDPYGYTVPLRLLDEIMKRPEMEVMLNFMYFGIVRNIENKQETENMKRIFGDDIFEADLKSKAHFDDEKIIRYIAGKIGNPYYIPYRVNFGIDEKVRGERLKYLLLFFTRSFKGFNIMLDVMWKHSNKDNPLTVSKEQPLLFPLKREEDLKRHLEEKYCGKGMTVKFDELLQLEWMQYFKEEHFRNVIKAMKKEQKAVVTPITSKTGRGLQGKDVIKFL